MRPATVPTPITDAETRQAVSLLKRYPSGLTRADLAKHFGSDRRGRLVMAALTERGIAPVQPPAGRPPRPKALPARLDPTTRRLLRAALDHHPALLEALVEAGRRA